MKLIDILEARKNPEQNKTEPVWDQLKQIYDAHPNAYITFTKKAKFGANPTSKYNTPLGICSYPISYYIQKKGVPFAGKNPYIFVFEPKESGNFLNVKADDPEVVALQIRRAIKRVLPGQSLSIKSESSMTDVWFGMYNAIHQYVSHTDEQYIQRVQYTGPYGILARKILRTAGYDGVIDPGTGLIHENEPTQSIFFNINQVKVITMVNNKLRPWIHEEYYTRIQTYSQWLTRLVHAIAARQRDRDVEKNIGKYFAEYLKMSHHDLHYLIDYAELNDQRIPAFEPYLLRGLESDMLKYAMVVVKGRWVEAEPKIMIHPTSATTYAIHIIKGRWPEAEPYIKERGDWGFYKKQMKQLGIKI